MSDSDLMEERARAEDLESQLENALVRAENAEEKSDTAEDLEAALYKIAAEGWDKFSSWSESVARAELKKHGLKTPPERE